MASGVMASGLMASGGHWWQFFYVACSQNYFVSAWFCSLHSRETQNNS
jgi:hypothetical protein